MEKVKAEKVIERFSKMSESSNFILERDFLKFLGGKAIIKKKVANQMDLIELKRL